MSQTSSPAATPAADPANRTALTVAKAVLVAAVGAVLADALIALVARAAGASHAFRPLTPAAYIPLTVIGVLAGAVAWQIIRRRAADPSSLLRRLVPIVVALSLIPDVAVGLGHSQVGTTWGGVAALMVMHLAVAAIAVPVFRRLLPLR